jgi:acylphosphatase
VSGIVQGVLFRSQTAMMAYRRNVRGWVRNLRDGRVEAIFEGEREDVEEVLKYCRRGPAGAVVEGFEASWEDYKGEFSGFTIA